VGVVGVLLAPNKRPTTPESGAAAAAAGVAVKYLPMPHLLLPGVQIYQSQWVQLAQVDLSGDQVLRQVVPPASQVGQAAQAYQQGVDLLLDLLVRVAPAAAAMLGVQLYR
jgi:hypothetical protein